MSLLSFSAAVLLIGARPLDADRFQVNVELSTPQATVFVGQPIKVLICLTASNPATVYPEAVQLWMSDGTGFREYRSPDPAGRPFWPSPPALAKDETWTEERTIDITQDTDAHGVSRFSFALGVPGDYQLKARYAVGDVVRESAAVVLTAQMPPASERALLAVLQRQPLLLNASAIAFDPMLADVVRHLVAQYPESPYLAAAKLGLWRYEIRERLGADADAGSGLLRLLDGIAAEQTQGLFEAERLQLLARTWLGLGNREEARRLYEALVRQFPRQSAAREAQEWLRGEEASERLTERLKDYVPPAAPPEKERPTPKPSSAPNR